MVAKVSTSQRCRDIQKQLGFLSVAERQLVRDDLDYLAGMGDDGISEVVLVVRDGKVITDAKQVYRACRRFARRYRQEHGNGA